MDSNEHYDLTDLLNELPAALSNGPDSNNAKLLSVLADDMVDMQELIDQVNLWRDITNAKGGWLDKIGTDWGVARNGFDDDFYRFMIRTKQLQRQVDGSYNSIIKLIAESLGANYSEINVTPVKDEPNAIEVTNIPAGYIDSQRKEKLVLDQIRSSVAAGIRVAGIGFQKTVKSTLYYAMQFQTTQVIESTMSVPQLKKG
ncbi:hypothetical protein [Levilactobacillus yiduensis]|uniref:hypothetical protein n=1 Tax=Levilactobacillus yiduensis TaxID=2953880 RepID=UPI0021581255|nr:hypothetical protein [Levilactobacillus yiduensis]